MHIKRSSCRNEMNYWQFDYFLICFGQEEQEEYFFINIVIIADDYTGLHVCQFV